MEKESAVRVADITKALVPKEPKRGNQRYLKP